MTLLTIPLDNFFPHLRVLIDEVVLLSIKIKCQIERILETIKLGILNKPVHNPEIIPAQRSKKLNNKKETKKKKVSWNLT